MTDTPKTSIESKIVQVLTKELDNERRERQRLEVENMALRNTIGENIKLLEAMQHELDALMTGGEPKDER